MPFIIRGIIAAGPIGFVVIMVCVYSFIIVTGWICDKFESARISKEEMEIASQQPPAPSVNEITKENIDSHIEKMVIKLDKGIRTLEGILKDLETIHSANNGVGQILANNMDSAYDSIDDLTTTIIGLHILLSELENNKLPSFRANLPHELENRRVYIASRRHLMDGLVPLYSFSFEQEINRETMIELKAQIKNLIEAGANLHISLEEELDGINNSEDRTFKARCAAGIFGEYL